ncbi:hypothetical protein NUW54_g12481 [Trametes sanguinea]|uniref:Uncharacterized protein n=1 Tax=Trametes sanguinea TaxID=158606 RepID=A0ACC1MY34_9APHY|nr:hypothetical protein NUW54_g12481 [Trametes sanguinea]
MGVRMRWSSRETKCTRPVLYCLSGTWFASSARAKREVSPPPSLPPPPPSARLSSVHPASLSSTHDSGTHFPSCVQTLHCSEITSTKPTAPLLVPSSRASRTQLYTATSRAQPHPLILLGLPLRIGHAMSADVEEDTRDCASSIVASGSSISAFEREKSIRSVQYDSESLSSRIICPPEFFDPNYDTDITWLGMPSLYLH